MARIGVNERSFGSVQFGGCRRGSARSCTTPALRYWLVRACACTSRRRWTCSGRRGPACRTATGCSCPPALWKRRSHRPRRVTLYDRHGRNALFLEGHRCYYGPGSDCLYIRDHRTGERRHPLLGDVAEAMTVCDALPHVDFVMSMFMPSDVDPLTSDRRQMEVMLIAPPSPSSSSPTSSRAARTRWRWPKPSPAEPTPCGSARGWPATSTLPARCATTRTPCRSCCSWPGRGSPRCTFRWSPAA